MFRIFYAAILFLIFFPAAAWAGEQLGITSSSIVGGKIAKLHACGKQGGGNKSPQISVSGVPAGSKFLAVIMDDPDAMAPAGKVWVHWNIVNIPATHVSFPVGTKPPGKELTNSGRGTSYGGMCPPDGEHEYRIAVFAMKDEIDAGGFFGPSELTVEDFANKYGDKILAQGMIKGKF